jgi:hypothetical protein
MAGIGSFEDGFLTTKFTKTTKKKPCDLCGFNFVIFAVKINHHTSKAQ